MAKKWLVPPLYLAYFMANPANAINKGICGAFFNGGAYGVRTRDNLAIYGLNSINKGVSGSHKMAAAKNLVPKLYPKGAFLRFSHLTCTQKLYPKRA